MHYLKNNISSEEALELLEQGNQRFVAGLRSLDTMIRSKDLKDLAEQGQKPFVIILACSDSRVPVEVLFDRGPGDIFVCRVAGNVATPAIMGSIEFAADQFGSALCVVMGHTRCGAIRAALELKGLSTDEVSPNIRKIVEEIEPAARLGRSQGPISPQVVDRTAWLNVFHTLTTLTGSSRLIREKVAQNKLKLVGALCHIHDGSVEFERDWTKHADLKF